MTASTLAPAEKYNDFRRYQLAAGKLIEFHRPPLTTHYKIGTTPNSIGVKGTLVELQPTSSSPSSTTLPELEEWDTYPNYPLYAARYENPLVSKESRTIYWEVDIGSSSSTTETPTDDDENNTDLDSLAEAKDINGELLMGFVVKDTTRLENMRKNLAQSGTDPRLHSTPTDTITIGPSLLVNTHTGTVYSDGIEIPTQYPIPTTAKTIGIGITFAFNPSSIPPPSSDEEKKKNMFKRFLDKHSTPPIPSALPEELRPVPVAVFTTVDGEEMVGVDISAVDMVKMGFDGTRDVYPAVVVRGGGVKAVMRFGECVGWSGAGGSEDAKVKGLGNRAKPRFKEPRWPFKANNTYGWWGM